MQVLVVLSGRIDTPKSFLTNYIGRGCFSEARRDPPDGNDALSILLRDASRLAADIGVQRALPPDYPIPINSHIGTRDCTLYATESLFRKLERAKTPATSGW